MALRSLEELINRQEPGWALVQEWMAEAKNHVEVLPADDQARQQALLQIQVTTRSPMGAIVYESGGLLVDHGWLRILGSGHPRLPRSLPDWTREATGMDPLEAPYVLIADDVLGGLFALDSGYLGDHGKVFFLAPDTMSWENTELGYSDFIYGLCFQTDLDKYYNNHRWPGWQEDIKDLGGDQAMSVMPPLCLKSGLQSEATLFQNRSRKPIPMLESYRFFLDMNKQLSGLKDGAVIRFDIGQ
ncbi:MAG TPA: DUF2625 family protein [Candidatus Obscuribacter sp.]|nr:DUF2625 family protein [Candidatus Obscuribacter sp.]HNH74086.1 DUF2625 family protein [Candidatus Obscuribacter sp.]